MKKLTEYIIEKMVFNKNNSKQDYFNETFVEAYETLFNDENVNDIFYIKDNKKNAIYFKDNKGKEEVLISDDDIDKKDKSYFVSLLICHFLENKDLYKKLEYDVNKTLKFVKDYIYNDLKEYKFSDTECYEQNQYDGLYMLYDSKITHLDYSILLDIDPDVEVEPYDPGDYWTPPSGGNLTVVFNTSLKDIYIEVKDTYYEGNQVENIFELLELSKDEIKKFSDLGGKMYDLINEDGWIDHYREYYEE